MSVDEEVRAERAVSAGLRRDLETALGHLDNARAEVEARRSSGLTGFIVGAASASLFVGTLWALSATVGRFI